MNIHPGWTLFGLYEGVPQLERGTNYTAVLPDKTTIFQKPIEDEAVDEKDIKGIVKIPFGMKLPIISGWTNLRVSQVETKGKNSHGRISIEY